MEKTSFLAAALIALGWLSTSSAALAQDGFEFSDVVVFSMGSSEAVEVIVVANVGFAQEDSEPSSSCSLDGRLELTSESTGGTLRVVPLSFSSEEAVQVGLIDFDRRRPLREIVIGRLDLRPDPACGSAVENVSGSITVTIFDPRTGTTRAVTRSVYRSR